MRLERIQPKIAEEIAIPDDLLALFQDVDDLIKQNDELVTIESDDLIQTDFAYGGLIEEGADRFSFCYFPEMSTRPKWTIELTASEIAEISNGKKKELFLWKCQNPVCNSFFSSADEPCFDCDYLDDELEEKNSVLSSLSQSLSREDWVRGYLTKYPDASALQIIGDYNSQKLGERWGYLSLSEMQQLMEK